MEPDLAFLRAAARPEYEVADHVVRIADLFAGCGGMTLGLAHAAHQLRVSLDIALAVDFDDAIAGVYAFNFPKARVESVGVETIFDGQIGDATTKAERYWSRKVGPISWLQGGPPCQGHSDLNNHTRRDDPRNGFYNRMTRAAEVLAPSVVVIENVPTVRNDKGKVVQEAVAALKTAGYNVADDVMSLSGIGVPQRRRRHTLLALRGLEVHPGEVLADIRQTRQRDLEWAIGDLAGVDNDNPLDVPSRLSSDNAERIEFLFTGDGLIDLPNDRRPKCHQGDHSYKSMYGRLRWDQPAQTITSGYGSMGQGRYVHPSEKRTLTPHEAARIQFFPDWFDFTAGGLETRRAIWATMIGNAVPPKLTMELGRLLLPQLIG